jgi:ubiquinone/menaquinone biosynthesis C-methylase UbiE
MAESYAYRLPLQGQGSALGLARSPAEAQLDVVPGYLRRHYWWAYIHPRGVKLFERQWLVNLILWGNYARLRDAALNELGRALPGATLQVACAYGDLSIGLAERAGAGQGTADIVDVLPIQLQNLRAKFLRAKLPPRVPVRLLTMDSAHLQLPDRSYDRVLLFFLLHEQPPDVRRKTLQEAVRVVKPGGKIVIVDYARPQWWHPLRYLWRPLLATLEPFALDLWREDFDDWIPASCAGQSRSFFGGLYRMVMVIRNER